MRPTVVQLGSRLGNEALRETDLVEIVVRQHDEKQVSACPDVTEGENLKAALFREQHEHTIDGSLC